VTQMPTNSMFRVYLYPEPWAPTLSCEALAEYLKSMAPSFQVEVRDPFIAYHLARLGEVQGREAIDGLARGLAIAKVHNLMKHTLNESPIPGEISYERRRLETRSKVFGLFYDGIEMMHLMAGLIAPEERRLSHIHVIFTNQLFGTWEDDDRRYHARASLCGFPSLVSTTGLVEAPAKPREFYLLKQQYTALGMADAIDSGIKKEFSGRVLEHGDERLTEVAKGYVLQAIFNQVWGEPFCEDKGCRLFNAHWQTEMLAAQLGGVYDLCPRHEAMLGPKSPVA